MGRIQWAKAAQFNWTFDNMGGTPLMEAVHGNWSGASGQTAVAPDGQVYLQSPLLGGGQVYYLRGVWQASAVFPWNGFWAAPESGDKVNYYTGGSFRNQDNLTIITLGTGLPAGTAVQVYYVYLTGEQEDKYGALNSYPCIRPAYRERGDYTYDFAVDRILDLMATLHFAGRERGRDYSKIIEFLWEAFYARQFSLNGPLIMDNFERGRWDKGSYLLYQDSTLGPGGFEKFAIEVYPRNAGEEPNPPAAAEGPRALRAVLNDYTTSGFSAWWGYGMNWSLAESPFSNIDQVRFRLRGDGTPSQIRNVAKIKFPASGNTGSATLIIHDAYHHGDNLKYEIQITKAGDIGEAEFSWAVYDYQETQLEHQTGVKTSGREMPIALSNGIRVYWEPGASNDFELNDYWSFWAGDPETHPRRLQVLLNDSQPEDVDPWGAAHTFVHALPDRFTELTQFAVNFSQFWRIDNIVDDRDRRRCQWGRWYYPGEGGKCLITISDREETETIQEEIFYTQRQISWVSSGPVYSLGAWVGVDSTQVDSTGRTNVNFLLSPSIANVSSQNIRVKVQDVHGHYFYKDENVTIGSWQRVAINFSDFMPENAGDVLDHPINLIDIGIANNPPDAGVFLITDIKFDDHKAFASAGRLRLLEFKYSEIPLILSQAPAWWLDDVGVNLEAGDDYPYTPRLAISLSPYGQNAWRGPTLVHYAHPLAPYLVDRHDLKTTYLQLHRDSQDEFHSRYAGTKGAIVPVHTRNDIENIALCGEENFGEFGWWPRYRHYYKVVGFWHFNQGLSDASGKGHTLVWQGGGEPVYTTGICQPGNTSVVLDGSHYVSHANHNDFNMGTEDFTLEFVFKRDDLAQRTLLDKRNISGYIGYHVHIMADGRVLIQLTDSGGSVNHFPVPPIYLDDTDNFHYLGISVDRDGQIIFCYDGSLATVTAKRPGSLDNSNDLKLGAHITNAGHTFLGKFDLIRLTKGRALGSQELQDNCQIARNQLNGSAYPEVGHGLGQYWAFYRLAEYYFTSNDPAAWEILENWLNWFNHHIAT
ncbi:MAG: LamG-like jellyroll fold domain-containing protein [Desulfobacteraceae bacterium]